MFPPARRHVRFGLLLLAGVGACRSGPATKVASEELLGLEADQVMVELETYLTREGVRRGRLRADSAYSYEDEGRLVLRNLRLTFFDEEGRPAGELTGRSGEYLLETGDVEVEGNVVVVDEAADKQLRTARLRYVAAVDSLYGDTAFVFRRGSVQMRGASFVSDPNLENVRAEAPTVEVPGVVAPG